MCAYMIYIVIYTLTVRCELCYDAYLGSLDQVRRLRADFYVKKKIDYKYSFSLCFQTISFDTQISNMHRLCMVYMCMFVCVCMCIYD